MSFCIARAIALTFVIAFCCYPQTLKIWPGEAPGSETWTQKERVEKNTPVGTVVFNVVTPTLTVYLPERSKATGTGIIIAPGGAFVALAIDLEGHDVARWLQDKGIAAFVLKYRIMEKRQEGIPDLNMDEAGKYGIADGIQAVKVVRQHAAELGISPDRVGFMGFSAGAMVARELCNSRWLDRALLFLPSCRTNGNPPNTITWVFINEAERTPWLLRSVRCRILATGSTLR